MSEGVVSGREAPGPVWVLPDDIGAGEALRGLGRSVGWHVARIDLDGCRDKAELLERTASALAFPQWFGGNWDALYDCLADLGWRSAPGHLLVFEHAGDLRREAPEVFDTAVAVLNDAAATWDRRGVPFRAFLLG